MLRLALLVVVVAGVIRYAWVILAALAAVAARADQQHAWVLAGDDRGTYNEYRPEVYPTGSG